METCSTVETTSTDRYVSSVKWFNNKAGYGFLTVTTGPLVGTDVFVHHSGITVSNEQYKYLVQGEYVEYSLEKTEGGKHEYQAVNVSGINKGNLMCETRKEFKQTRTTYQETHVQDATTAPVQRKQQSVRKQQTAPTPSLVEDTTVPAPAWSLVKKSSEVKKTASKSQKGPRAPKE
jgi:cold shock CspA family protein